MKVEVKYDSTARLTPFDSTKNLFFCYLCLKAVESELVPKTGEQLCTDTPRYVAYS